jgi:cysteine-rich repeat protein
VVQTGLGEQCDDGNTTSGDGCDSGCQNEGCGDGVVQPGLGEQCDDGNTVSGDGCSSSCQNEICGDGVVTGTEQCDDGNSNNNDACLSTCMNASCGDGYQWSGVEQCDDGNTTPGDGCNASCQNEYCGDGVVQTGLGEQCDDGNASAGDGCSAACQWEYCGDGVVQAGLGEECDDGNTFNGDGCSSGCLLECDTTENLALTATASSSGGGTTSTGYGPDRMNDGYGHAYCASYNAHWVTADNYPAGKWIQLTWTTTQTIGRIVIDTVNINVADCIGANTGRVLAGGTIQWWNGSSWVTAGSVSGYTNDWTYNFPTPVNTTRIRIYDLFSSSGVGQSSNPIIIEWQAFCD